MSDGRIFINYRREDSSGESGRLFDNLVERYGEERVFRDVDRGTPGVPFPELVDSAVRGSTVVLIVIGRRWLDDVRSRAAEGVTDYVLMEIRTALQHRVHVIPVLLDGTPMPSPRDLPEDLAPLSTIGAQELSQSRWEYDVSRLFKVLDGLVAPQPPPTPPPPPSPPIPVPVGRVTASCLVISLLAVAVLVVGIILAVRTLGPIVTGSASITLAPDSGTGGTSVEVTGHGFFPNESVEIFFQGQPVGTPTADGEGSFKKQITVPNNFSVFHGDSLTVSAAGKTSAKSADAQFTIK